MNKLPGFSPRANPEARSFDFFFDRLDTCLRKGRGFSLFQADDACVTDFSEQCGRQGPGSLEHPPLIPSERRVPAGYVGLAGIAPICHFDPGPLVR